MIYNTKLKALLHVVVKALLSDIENSSKVGRVQCTNVNYLPITRTIAKCMQYIVVFFLVIIVGYKVFLVRDQPIILA